MVWVLNETHKHIGIVMRKLEVLLCIYLPPPYSYTWPQDLTARVMGASGYQIGVIRTKIS